jgi:hypothetical protein
MTTTGGPYADTRDMYMVHTMLRREFALLPALVRDVTAGDEERTQIVADHIEFLGTILHAHHHSEDVYLWPKLLDRGSEEIVPIVHLMEGQHTSIEKINAEVTAATGSWGGSSAAGTARPWLRPLIDWSGYSPSTWVWRNRTFSQLPRSA